MVHAITPQMLQSKDPSYFPNWAQLYQNILKPPYEIAILGDDWDLSRSKLAAHYLPNAMYLGGSTEGSLALLKDKATRRKYDHLRMSEPGLQTTY